MALRHQLMRDIASYPKIGILVDGTRDQACHVVLTFQWHPERRRKRGSGLYRGKCRLSDVGIAHEAKR